MFLNNKKFIKGGWIYMNMNAIQKKKFKEIDLDDPFF